MKSVEMTAENYAGIPADVEAFTTEDEKKWLISQDIACLPNVIATLKGLRKLVTVTSFGIRDAENNTVPAGKELSVRARDRYVVHLLAVPAYSFPDATWTSASPTKVKVTKLDETAAVIEPLEENASAITITATVGSQTATCTIKPVA